MTAEITFRTVCPFSHNIFKFMHTNSYKISFESQSGNHVETWLRVSFTASTIEPMAIGNYEWIQWISVWFYSIAQCLLICVCVYFYTYILTELCHFCYMQTIPNTMRALLINCYFANLNICSIRFDSIDNRIRKSSLHALCLFHSLPIKLNRDAIVCKVWSA